MLEPLVGDVNMLTNILSEAGDDGEDGLDVGGDVRHLAQCVQHRPSNHLPARVHR